MEPKVNYILVGLFVAILGAAGLIGVLWLGKMDYRGVYDRYEAYFRESVAGLSEDSTVKYRGVDVGRVRSISLNPDNPEEVRLILDIARGTPIKTDTVAVLETQGLTGLATINLTGGSKDAPPLVALEGQEYPVIKTGPSPLFFRLDEAISRLLSDKGLANLLASLESLAKGASETLDEENRLAVKQTIKELSEIVHSIAVHRKEVEATLHDASQSANHLVKVTTLLHDEVPMLVARINKSAEAFSAMTEELAKTSRSVHSIVDENRTELERFSKQTLPEAAMLVTELRQLANILTRVAQDLEREPNALVFGKTPPRRGPGE
ncbi:MAG: MCE family protein [Nitrospira sp.]|nr:MCE family protein [Nitrospira sp.]MCP9443491.1 MCE family protein [Nitrospira sp.]